MATPTYKREHPTSRNVDCEDLFGRPRTVTTHSADGHVVLIAPAGEAATLTPQQARELAQLLLDRAMAIDHGRDPVHRWLKTATASVVPLRRP